MKTTMTRPRRFCSMRRCAYARLGSGRAVGDAERHDVRGESGDDARVGVVGVEPEKRAQKVEDGEGG